MAENSTDPLSGDQDYMVGPTSEIRIKTQTALLSLLLIFSIINNGIMLVLFARFKSLRRVTNYLLIDMTIVEFLDTVVNIPIFMEFFLMTKKKNLERQTRWYAMLFHRYFLLNDLFSQIFQIIDCFLAIRFGKQFTSKKTSKNIKAFIVFKWVVILAFLLAFMVPTYTIEEEYVSDEAYQRLLFGPNQVIWKIVIPSCQLFAVVGILMTSWLIKNSRNLVSKRYGMRTFGKGSKNSAKAVNTLTLIMVVQTLCKVPAAAYSYVAVDDRVEGNRWFAFFSYFFLFLSSSFMPLIYFWRTMAFRRALQQIRKHPFAASAYLDYAAQHGLTTHRNGRLHLDHKVIKRNERISPKSKGVLFAEAENTRETDFSSRTTHTSSRPLSLATEVSLLEIPMSVLPRAHLELASCRDEKPRPERCRTKTFYKNEESQGNEEGGRAKSSSPEGFKTKTEESLLQSSSSGASGPCDDQDVPDDSKHGNGEEEEAMQDKIEERLNNTVVAMPRNESNVEAAVSCKTVEEQVPIAEDENMAGSSFAEQKEDRERNEEEKVHEEGSLLERSAIVDDGTQVSSTEVKMDDTSSAVSRQDAREVASHESDAKAMQDQKPLQELENSKEKEEGPVVARDSSKEEQKDVANKVKKDKEAPEKSSLVVQAMIPREYASADTAQKDAPVLQSLDDNKQDFEGNNDDFNKEGEWASMEKNSLVCSQETTGASDQAGQAHMELGYDNLGFDTKL